MPDAREEALESARRVFDRKVNILDNIDDKAMRTVRTAVLILGFVVGALTTTGISPLGDLAIFTAGFGIAGVFFLLVSAVVGIGIYTVSRYPTEIRRGDIYAAPHVDDELWVEAAASQMDDAISELDAEITQNAELLVVCQIALLLGTSQLVLATASEILRRIHGIQPRWVAVTLVALATVSALVTRPKME